MPYLVVAHGGLDEARALGLVARERLVCRAGLEVQLRPLWVRRGIRLKQLRRALRLAPPASFPGRLGARAVCRRPPVLDLELGRGALGAAAVDRVARLKA